MDETHPEETVPPRGEEGLLHTTLRLETEGEDGGLIAATAFIYEYAVEDTRYPFLVTARHVVATAREGRLTFIPELRGRPDLSKGYTLDIENFAKLWYLHPDPELDVAVTPFAPFVKHIEDSGVPLYYRPLREVDDTLGAQALAPCIVAAYPQGVCGPRELLPVLVTARVASARVGDYAGRDHFLVSTVLYPGSAGAPLLVRRADGGIALGGLLSQGYVAGERCALLPLAEAFAHAPPVLGGVLRVRVVRSLVFGYLREKGFV